MIQIWVSFMSIFYIFQYTPFIEYSDNITEFLNELTVLLVFTCLTTNANGSSDINTQYQLGFFLIALILINILVNFSLFLKNNIVKIYKLIKDLPNRKHRIAKQKYLEEAQKVQVHADLYDKIYLTSQNYTNQADDQFNDSQEAKIIHDIEEKKNNRIRIFGQHVARLKEELEEDDFQLKKDELDQTLRKNQILYSKIYGFSSSNLNFSNQSTLNADKQKLENYKQFQPNQVSKTYRKIEAEKYMNDLIRKVANNYKSEYKQDL
ncbi:UNKNOWN [Stylonychia lemnae]|uniref:Uncharacterized protein n=1 Tax=Stylonychia lemnae TaxID=5949 RepID=A0A078AQT0_STYLE|nr:UNKNOWN [Stylonychia lemnae]|eukprot:CDW83597.1 UNKNOWN [Stylonychia lemnae]